MEKKYNMMASILNVFNAAELVREWADQKEVEVRQALKQTRAPR